MSTSSCSGCRWYSSVNTGIPNSGSRSNERSCRNSSGSNAGSSANLSRDNNNHNPPEKFN